MRKVTIRSITVAVQESPFFTDLKKKGEKFGCTFTENSNHKFLWIFFPYQNEIRPYVLVDSMGKDLTVGCMRGGNSLFKERISNWTQLANRFKQMYTSHSLKGANALAQVFMTVNPSLNYLEASSDEVGFKSWSKEKQERYIKKHPGSKYAKDAKKAEETKKSVGQLDKDRAVLKNATKKKVAKKYPVVKDEPVKEKKSDEKPAKPGAIKRQVNKMKKTKDMEDPYLDKDRAALRKRAEKKLARKNK